jgi:hypothetical protein
MNDSSNIRNLLLKKQDKQQPKDKDTFQKEFFPNQTSVQ